MDIQDIHKTTIRLTGQYSDLDELWKTDKWIFSTFQILCQETQYPPIVVKSFQHSHDRSLCIDDAVYHIRAFLKDLCEKLFAFSKMILKASDFMAKCENIMREKHL
jgi:hypothetical protein